jgi:hypothetical protein
MGVLGQIEIFITDWNSEAPLSESIELTSEAAAISHFLYVRPDIANKYHPSEDQVFNAPCATNAAIRRASGRFICFMPADILFPPIPLLNLIKIMMAEIEFPYDLNKCMLKISRKMVPWQLVEKEPDLQNLEDFFINTSGKFPGNTDFFWAMPDLNCGLGAFVASKALWHLSRGFDENLTGWGFSDIEFGLRIEQIYPGLELSHYGIFVYDLAQKPTASVARTKRLNISVYHDRLQANSYDWGLGHERLEIQQAGEFVRSVMPFRDKSVAHQQGFIFRSRTDMVRQMANREYYDFLKEHLPFTKKLPMKWKFIYPLVWYGLTFPLNKYLEFGVSDMSGASIAALTNSCVDITIVSDWQDNDNQTAQMSPVEIAAFLRDVDHKGRYRFIEGDVATALERLSATSNERVLYDLVFFQPDMFGKKAPTFFENVLGCLSNNGAIVIAGTSDGAFPICWNEAIKKHPSYTYIHCFKNEIGVILKSSMEVKDENLSEAEMQRILRRAWRPIKARKNIYYLSMVFGSLTAVLKNMYYEPLRQWPKISFRLINKYFRSRRIS